MNNTVRSCMAAAALAFSLAANTLCAQFAASQPATAPAEDPVIMRVNGEPVLQSQLSQIEQALVYQQMMAMQQGGMAGGMPDIEGMQAAAAKEARERVIGMSLLDQAMAAESKGITDKAIDARIEQIREMLKEDGMTLDDMLEQTNMQEADIRDNIRDELGAIALVEKTAGPVTPTEEEIKAFFEQNKEEMGSPAELRTSHILIGFGTPENPVAEPDEKQKAELLEKSQAILKRVQDGEDFAKLAAEESSCPSREQGGDLDFQMRGRMVPEYEDAAWNLEIGQTSGVVETAFGYHIIKATGKKEAVEADFDKMKTRIREMMRESKLRDNLPKIVEDLRKEAKVEDVVQPEKIAPPASAPAASQPAE